MSWNLTELSHQQAECWPKSVTSCLLRISPAFNRFIWPITDQSTSFKMSTKIWNWAALWVLTHWGRVTHISDSKLTIIGSDNGLSPGRRQAIIWTNIEIILTGPLGTNFSKLLIDISSFSFKKMHLKMLSWKWRQFCLGLNVLTVYKWLTYLQTDPILCTEGAADFCEGKRTGWNNGKVLHAHMLQAHMQCSAL